MTDPREAPIYVAGHRGLVGSAIVRSLEAKGYRNLVTRTHAELDLIDQHAVAGFFQAEKPAYVFLAAAKVGGIHANDTYRGEFIYKNLMIQTNIMHQAWLAGVRRLVFLGSSCIYPKEAPQPIREEYLMTGPLETTNSPYAVAKIAGVEMCDAYNRQYGTSYVPVMPTNLFGPGDNFNLETSHVLPALMRKFHLAKLAMAGDFEAIARDERKWGPIPEGIMRELKNPNGPRVVLWGTGKPRREFLYVDDMADACTYVMFETEATDLLNIGTGEDVTIAEVAETIRQVVGCEAEVVFNSDMPDGTMRKQLDVDKIQKMGWKPKTDLREGIRKSYDWYLTR